MSVLYQQNPDIHFRQVDGECFLADGEMNSLFNLNDLGTAVWRVMSTPMTIDNVSQLLIEAFPDTDAGRIRSDVKALFVDLINAGIIIEVGEAEETEGQET